jgi:hypothetical protein
VLAGAVRRRSAAWAAMLQQTPDISLDEGRKRERYGAASLWERLMRRPQRRETGGFPGTGLMLCQDRVVAVELSISSALRNRAKTDRCFRRS